MGEPQQIKQSKPLVESEFPALQAKASNSGLYGYYFFCCTDRYIYWPVK